MTWNNVKNQYFVTIWVNILSICYGTSIGWPSPCILTLQSKDSPLDSGPITKSEASWIVSLMFLIAFFSNYFYGWLADKIGRKKTLLSLAVPQIISWMLIIIGTNPIYLYISRIFCGISAGGVFVVIPLYITEIADDTVRGTLSSFLILFTNVGILISFVLGHYLSYLALNYALLLFPILLLFGFRFLPETPNYLLKVGREIEAKETILFLRNLASGSQTIPESVLKELENLKGCNNSDSKKEENNSLSFADFNNPVARKALLIGFALLGLNQFSGCFALLNYTASIFADSGSSLSPNMSAIIVGVIQLVGTYASTMLVEKAGRKILLCVSAFGTGIGLICLGLYRYFQVLEYDMSSFGWVPVASFSFAILIAAIGVIPLPVVVLMEVMPPKIRTVGAYVCMSQSWLVSFILIKYLYILADALQFHGLMFLFACFCFAGAIFILKVVPETRGKSIETILRMLE